MPLLSRLKVLAAKIEGTVGTPESLSAADGAFNAYDINIQPNVEVQQREAPGSLEWLQGVPGARAGTATFKTEVGWDGTVTLPAWAETLLPACGFVKTGTTFTPRSEAPGTNVKSVTIGDFTDKVLKQLAGAVGTFKIMLPTGKMAFIEWEFRGVFQEVVDQALIEPTLPTGLPIRFASATVQNQAVDQCVESMTVDAGSNIILRECPNTAGGYVSGLITDREPKISMNPEARLVADEDRYGDFLNGVQGQLAITLDGTDTSTIAITAPKAQIATIQEGDRNKLVTDDIELMCQKNGATKDKALSIEFTATV